MDIVQQSAQYLAEINCLIVENPKSEIQHPK